MYKLSISRDISPKSKNVNIMVALEEKDTSSEKHEMSVKQFVPICPVDVEIFPCWWKLAGGTRWKKITKVRRVHPLVTMNVCTRFSSCWDISVWTKVLEWQTDISVHRAAWLNKRNGNYPICLLSNAVQFCVLISGICGLCQRNVSNQLWWKHICQINRMASLHFHSTIVQKWLWNFWHVVKTCPQQPPRNVIPSVAPIYKAPVCGCVTIAVCCKVNVFVVVFEQCEMWPTNELLKESSDVSHAIGQWRNLHDF